MKRAILGLTVLFASMHYVAFAASVSDLCPALLSGPSETPIETSVTLNRTLVPRAIYRTYMDFQHYNPKVRNWKTSEKSVQFLKERLSIHATVTSDGLVEIAPGQGHWISEMATEIAPHPLQLDPDLLKADAKKRAYHETKLRNIVLSWSDLLSEARTGTADHEKVHLDNTLIEQDHHATPTIPLLLQFRPASSSPFTSLLPEIYRATYRSDEPDANLKAMETSWNTYQIQKNELSMTYLNLLKDEIRQSYQNILDFSAFELEFIRQFEHSGKQAEIIGSPFNQRISFPDGTTADFEFSYLSRQFPSLHQLRIDEPYRKAVSTLLQENRQRLEKILSKANQIMVELNESSRKTVEEKKGFLRSFRDQLRQKRMNR